MPRGTDVETLIERLPEEWKDVPILSFSQLTTADRCEFKWYVKYQVKYKGHNNNKRMDTGSFAHVLLQDLYMSIKDGMTAREWEEKRLNAVVMDIIDGLKFPEDQMQSVATAMQVVQRYCQTDILEGHTPVAAEEHFFVLVTTTSGRRFILQGYVDLITIDALGRVWIWDHKGGQGLWPKMRVRMEIQLPIYEILLRSEGLDVYGVCVNQLNCYPYKNMNEKTNEDLFKRDFDVRSPLQLQNIWAEFVALAESVLDLLEGKKPVRRSLQDHDCFKCDVAGPCLSALNGTPIDEAIEGHKGQWDKFREMPAGDSVTIIF